MLGLTLAACGGGGSDPPPPSAQPAISQFTSDRTAYFVGEKAQLTATYSGGTGRIEPGNIAVASGQTIATPVLAANISYRLVVTGSSASVERELPLEVRYREQLRTLAMPFVRTEHTASLLSDGRVLILGGSEGGTIFPGAMYVFDTATETFTQRGSLSTGRVAHVAVTLPSGDVLVAYGARSNTAAPVAEIVHASDGTVTPTANAPLRRRSYATATLLANGKVLITGGLSGSTQPPIAEIYDPASATFAAASGSMNVDRSNHTATLLDNGLVLLYGGFGYQQAMPPPELFDPASGTFTALPSAESLQRADHQAVKMKDGSVWIVGGIDHDGAPIGSVLRFNPTTREFTRASDLATARSVFGARQLTDGRLLIAGGVLDLGREDPAERITARTELLTTGGVRHDGPSMSVARFSHTVTALPNGKLLVVGGSDPTFGVLGSAEIFE